MAQKQPITNKKKLKIAKTALYIRTITLKGFALIEIKQPSILKNNWENEVADKQTN